MATDHYPLEEVVRRQTDSFFPTQSYRIAVLDQVDLVNIYIYIYIYNCDFLSVCLFVGSLMLLRAHAARPSATILWQIFNRCIFSETIAGRCCWWLTILEMKVDDSMFQRSRYVFWQKGFPLCCCVSVSVVLMGSWLSWHQAVCRQRCQLSCSKSTVHSRWLKILPGGWVEWGREGSRVEGGMEGGKSEKVKEWGEPKLSLDFVLFVTYLETITKFDPTFGDCCMVLCEAMVCVRPWPEEGGGEGRGRGRLSGIGAPLHAYTRTKRVSMGYLWYACATYLLRHQL